MVEIATWVEVNIHTWREGYKVKLRDDWTKREREKERTTRLRYEEILKRDTLIGKYGEQRTKKERYNDKHGKIRKKRKIEIERVHPKLHWQNIFAIFYTSFSC